MCVRAAELKQYFSQQAVTPSVICIAETRFKDPVSFSLPGYNMFHKNRPDNTRQGGVAIFVKSSLLCKVINFTTDIECIGVEVRARNTVYNIINVYHPPGGPHTQAEDDYKAIFDRGGHVIITGDFNAANTLWKSANSDRRGKIIEAMLDEYNYTSLNTGHGTRQNYTGGMSVLDLTFVSNGLAHKCEWRALDSTLGSDHVPTVTQIDSHLDEECTTATRWRISKGNWKLFSDTVSSSDLSLIASDDINVYNDNIIHVLLNAATAAIPVSRPVRNTKFKKVPYRSAVAVVSLQRDYSSQKSS